MKELTDLTEEHINALASTWALIMDRSLVGFYKDKLNLLKKNELNFDRIPFGVAKGLKKLNYNIPKL